MFKLKQAVFVHPMRFAIMAEIWFKPPMTVPRWELNID